MCGIAGFFDKTGQSAPVGCHLLKMLDALGNRGPDSAGVAVWGAPAGDDEMVLRLKAGEEDATGIDVASLEARLRPFARIIEREITGAYLRLIVEAREEDVEAMSHAIEAGSDIEVVSAGRSLEIVKQVGTPQRLEKSYAISQVRGTHGIGHTRLSTESRIDLSHSQPFWAHGTPDLAIVHNGHITNYHKLRRLYEERGVKFYTDNDSEVIGLYLRDRMARGDSFEESLQASMSELDGSFCYLAATTDTLAFVKDSYSFKPLVVAETDEWTAIATEEIALHRAFGDGLSAREPAARQIQVWKQSEAALVA